MINYQNWFRHWLVYNQSDKILKPHSKKIKFDKLFQIMSYILIRIRNFIRKVIT